MKNNLFYLIGVASLLSYTGTFTSCVNGVDDEYLEQKFTEDNGASEEGEELPDINGDYGKGGDYELHLTYNGEELGGKLVSVAADETNETATLILSGGEVDLETALATAIPGGVGGLISGLGLKYTSNSPIPGEKEVTFTNVRLYKNGTDYAFDGEDMQPTHTITYKGKIQDGKLNIDITNQLANDLLVGTWNLDTANPIYFGWDTNIRLSLGKLPELGVPIAINQKPTGVWSLANMFVKPVAGLKISQLVTNLLQSITTEKTGGIFATYSYSEDITQPMWSSEMSHKIVRYYYGDEPGKLYLDIDVDYIMSLVTGLINPASTRDVDPGTAKEAAKQLAAVLVPALAQGIPCTYELTKESDKILFYIDGAFLLEVFKKLEKIANDPYLNPFILDFIHNDASMATYAPIIEGLLVQLPYLLTYHDAVPDNKNGYENYNERNQRPINPTGECTFIKLGFTLTKAK